jgi:hypothetical protein
MWSEEKRPESIALWFHSADFHSTSRLAVVRWSPTGLDEHVGRGILVLSNKLYLERASIAFEPIMTANFEVVAE